MKMILFRFISFCLLLCFSQLSIAATPKIYAVVVGVSKYRDNSIPDLKYSEKDAQAFYNFLRSPYAGAVPGDNITLLLGANATRSNIVKSVVDIFGQSTKDDMIIFYFSGHGVGDESDNSGYLLSYDAEYGNEPATALSMDELESKIDKRQAKLKVSYVDACHAGLFKSGGKGTLEDDNAIISKAYIDNLANANEGHVAFLASTARQQSLEDDKLSNGVFTYYLLKGLQGEADKEEKGATGYNDGLVTVGEMATYLSSKIPQATKYKQKPTVNGEYDEGFPLSVLRTNVAIAGEMAKRPEKKNMPRQNKTSAPIALDKPADEKLSFGKTYSNSICHGICTFINNSTNVLNLYYMNGRSRVATSIQILPGKMAVTPRIGIEISQTGTDCSDKFHDVNFYFSKESNGVKQYAVYKTPIEAGKNQYHVIDEGTLTFSASEPR